MFKQFLVTAVLLVGFVIGTKSTVEFGVKGRNDQRLYIKSINFFGVPFFLRTATIQYRSPNNERITYIMAVNQEEDDDNVNVEALIEGDYHEKATIELNAARGHGIYYIVEIYGHSANEMAGPQQPDVMPTKKPEVMPTKKPEVMPTKKPDVIPTKKPGVKPSKKPGVKPNKKPGVKPTKKKW